MLANTPPMLECHYGVPMTGAVLNALNTRLDAQALAFILDHGEAKILITDREFAGVIKETLKLARVKPIVIDYDDPEFPQTGESWARSNTRLSLPAAIRTSPGIIPPTSGMRSPSIHVGHGPAIPRVSSSIIAARR